MNVRLSFHPLFSNAPHFRVAKRILLPNNREYRRIRAGVAAGCWLPMSYQSDLRMMSGIFERPLIPWINKFFRSV